MCWPPTWGLASAPRSEPFHATDGLPAMPCSKNTVLLRYNTISTGPLHEAMEKVTSMKKGGKVTRNNERRKTKPPKSASD
jgi:hypothetical protein